MEVVYWQFFLIRKSVGRQFDEQVEEIMERHSSCCCHCRDRGVDFCLHGWLHILEMVVLSSEVSKCFVLDDVFQVGDIYGRTIEWFGI